MRLLQFEEMPSSFKFGLFASVGVFMSHNGADLLCLIIGDMMPVTLETR